MAAALSTRVRLRMDLSRLSLVPWPLAIDLPEGLLAALVSAIATLALMAILAPRRLARAARAPARRPAAAPATS